MFLALNESRLRKLAPCVYFLKPHDNGPEEHSVIPALVHENPPGVILFNGELFVQRNPVSFIFYLFLFLVSLSIGRIN